MYNLAIPKLQNSLESMFKCVALAYEPSDLLDMEVGPQLNFK